eukprot:7092621-Prymnesium_polylepis.1
MGRTEGLGRKPGGKRRKAKPGAKDKKHAAARDKRAADAAEAEAADVADIMADNLRKITCAHHYIRTLYLGMWKKFGAGGAVPRQRCHVGLPQPAVHGYGNPIKSGWCTADKCKQKRAQ